MNAPDQHSTSHRSILGWASSLVISHGLSVGPVVTLELAGKIHKDVVETIYAALVWLCETPPGSIRSSRPTARVTDKEALRAVVELLQEHGCPSRN